MAKRNKDEKTVTDPVLKKILDLLKEQGLQQQALADYLGLSGNVFTRWKYDGGKSYYDHILQIAEFFHVSPGYLLGDEEKTYEIYTAAERQLIINYRCLSASDRELVAALITSLGKKTQTGR